MTVQEAGDRRAGPVRIGLTGLSVLFGMEALRALTPLTVFILRDRFGWHAAAVAMAMLAVLATGFLAAPARRVAGPGRFLALAAGGLGAARLALQLWTDDPLAELGLAIAAAVLFFFALPALAGQKQDFVIGWLIGVAADTSLHGAWGTWDRSWRSDPVSLITVLALVALQWRLLVAVGKTGAGHAAGGGRTWAALGPLLFLELLVLGNVARLAALTGWRLEWAALWAVFGRVLAASASVSTARGRRPRWPAAAGLTLALAASLGVAWPRGVTAALLLVAGQVLTALLWSLAVGAAGESASPRRLSSGYGAGLMAFGVLLFAYYGGIDLQLPFSKEILPPIAALGLGGAATAGVRSRPASPPAGARLGHVRMAAVVLLAVPLIRLATSPAVATGAAVGFPLRLMTYNLHLGLDPRGHLGLERTAATIEADAPDVVALQEVSRGWAVGGSADVLAWLSRRLGMAYVFAPTADPLWGNAVLSRRPILDHRSLDLPTEDLLIRRGILSVRLDLGSDGPLEVIVTHYHHPRDGGAIRQRQSAAILDFWQGRGRAAIVGDFNARPGDPEIEALRRAGLGDVLDLAGVAPGYTHSSSRPVKRIDYIWISPDLAVREASVPSSPASDHLPVVATLEADPSLHKPPGL